MATAFEVYAPGKGGRDTFTIVLAETVEEAKEKLRKEFEENGESEFLRLLEEGGFFSFEQISLL